MMSEVRCFPTPHSPTVAMAILHGVQAVAALAAALSVNRLKNFKIPLTTNIPSWETGFPVPAIQVRGLEPFVAVTSGFAFMSSAAHITVLVFFSTYLADLRRGVNRFRWYEYAASSSVRNALETLSWTPREHSFFPSQLMIGLISQLFGVYDVLALVLIMSVNACMNFFGLLHETMNGGRDVSAVDWTSFVYGCFAGKSRGIGGIH